MSQRVYVAQLNQKLNIEADVEVCPISRDHDWKELSPFFLGPCTTPDGLEFQNMENLWQFSKVYNGSFANHVKAGRLGFSITEDFFAWREAGAVRTDAVRYPMGRGAKPLFSYWKLPRRPALRLGYIAARKLIYVPEYAKLAANTEAYAKLKRMYDKGKVIVLRDFDARHQELFADQWIKYLDDPARKMGHAYVLAMMLEYGENFYKRLVL